MCAEFKLDKFHLSWNSCQTTVKTAAEPNGAQLL